ncbi:BTAD domain-containing putative transcriptional regulator [Streptomyces sp. NPDC020875]|uniref:BTAD domain-containing putative transcriptional regulator n=1 Tax=Streptomyces sp. NPDC020875 TaxID=3154898 RepID=UPI0033C69790
MRDTGGVGPGGFGFGILGEVTVWAGDGSPVRVPELKVRTLLASLLVDPGRPVAAHRLIDDLWGDDTPGRPVRALQAKVSQLRRVLAGSAPDGRELLVSRAPGYQLVPGEGALDAAHFRTLATRARRVPDPAVRSGLLAEALAIWRGPAFADFADRSFVRAAAARWEEERLTAVEDRSEARLALGDHAALAAELAEPVAAHPLRERLRAAQLRALYASGRQGEALAGYESFRRGLADELGLDPGPELTALHAAMLRQDPSLDPPRPVNRSSTTLRAASEVSVTPVISAMSVGSTVSADAAAVVAAGPPAAHGELVGRDTAVAEVATLLAARRLVTLTGPGGVGKTRLALAVADRVAGDFPDGVRLVELAGSGRDPAEVVAAAIGLRDDGVWGSRRPGSPDERLAAALRGRRMLLVLDNCEHLVERAAALVELLLRQAPGLVVLTTSQEPLALAPETLWPVPPLSPAAAVELFAVRAAAGAPGFRLDDGNRAAVEAVARRLDGLPLALELAATRVRALGVHRLPDLLDDRFRVLRAGRRDAPARQRTLRAVIDWSWELLGERERAVLRRLAPHPDGYTLEAAEAVCAGDGVDGDDVLDLLARLVDRSLVRVVGDGDRYRLLESVAAYGLERLREAGEADAVRARHLGHDVRLVERAAAGLRGPEQFGLLARLDAENGNLRWAVDAAGATGDIDVALRLVDALTWYWVLRGRLAEARRTLTAVGELPGGAPAMRARVLVARAAVTVLAGDGGNRAALFSEALAETEAAGEAGDDPPGTAMARARWFLGHALHGTGDISAGEALTEPALDGFRSLGDRWGEAAALADRATQRLLRGDLAGARDDATRSDRLFAAEGDACGRLWPVFPLTAVAEIHGDYATARRLREEALVTARRFGLSTQVPELLSGLGRVALLTGDFGLARERHEEALRESAALDFRSGEINALIGLGLGARREGDPKAAERHMREVLDWHREVGLEGGNALILAELGFAAAMRGDAAEALRLQSEGYAAAVTTRDPRAVALALEGLADALVPVGRVEGAALLLGCAEAARVAAGAPLAAAERGDVERIGAAAAEALGEAVFGGAFARGGGLTPEQALVEAGVEV